MKGQSLYLLFTLVSLQLSSVLSVRCANIALKYGRVRYRSRGRIATFFCYNGYTLHGEKYAACFRNSWDVKPPKCVKRGCPIPRSFLYGLIERPLSNSAVISFSCFPGYLLVGPKEIYCNGVTYDSLPPVCKRQEYNVSCDFEEPNLCGWENDGYADLDWTRHKLNTPSEIGTGPSYDHTKGPNHDGNYLYLEVSNEPEGRSALLRTSFLPHASNNNTCFKFWYHMYGLNIGALKILINDTVVFKKEKNQGNRWHMGKVPLPEKGHFKLGIEGVVGNGVRGDIGIDDLSVEDCFSSKGNSCENRCGEVEPMMYTSCSCYQNCERDYNCCDNFKDFCLPEVTTTENIDVLESTSYSSDQEYSSTETVTFTVSPFTDMSTTDDYFLSLSTKGDKSYSELTDTLVSSTNNFDSSSSMSSYYTMETYSTSTEISNTYAESSVYITSFETKDPKITSLQYRFTQRPINFTVTSKSRYNFRPRLRKGQNKVSTLSKMASVKTTTPTLKVSKNSSALNPRMTTIFPKAPTPIILLNTSNKSHFKFSTNEVMVKPITEPTLVSEITSNKSGSKSSLAKEITKAKHLNTPRVVATTEFNWDNDGDYTFEDDYSGDTINQIPKTSSYSNKDGSTISIPRRTKWKSKYRPKGTYHYVSSDEKSDINWEAISLLVLISAAFIALVTAIAVSGMKRKLRSGPSDGADILFIPADELLDFNIPNSHSSAVYQETVIKNS